MILPDSFNLGGRRALVTGSSRGVGASLAHLRRSQALHALRRIPNGSLGLTH